MYNAFIFFLFFTVFVDLLVFSYVASISYSRSSTLILYGVKILFILHYLYWLAGKNARNQFSRCHPNWPFFLDTSSSFLNLIFFSYYKLSQYVIYWFNSVLLNDEECLLVDTLVGEEGRVVYCHYNNNK